MRELLTKNFYRDEFECKGKNCCGHSAPINLFFVERLQIFRQLLGNVPLIINSGFRCNIHNATVSIPTSEHTKGIAADIERPKSINAETIFVVAKESKLFGGIGIYNTFIHLDNGPKGREWDERS